MMGKHAKTLKNQILFKLQQAIDWICDGDPPPKSHYRSLGLMFFLIIIGTILAVCFFLSHFEIALTDELPVAWPFLGLSFLTLPPGLYVLFVSICCWRRVKGYGWWMIPPIEEFW